MITEHLMRPGSGSLRFVADVPAGITDQIQAWVDEAGGGEGAHVVVTSAPIDPDGLALADLLSAGLYAGPVTARPSRRTLEFAGLSKWLDSYLDVTLSRSSGTPTQWVGDIVDNGLSAGTNAGGGSNVSRTLSAHSVTLRQALDNVSQLGGWEYEIRPDFTIDYGTAANLFRAAGDDGTVVVTAREEGPDGTFRGVDGGLLDQNLSRLGPSIATKAVVLAEGGGAAIAKGSDTTTVNLKAWDGTTPTLVTVFSAPSEEANSADIAAENFLNLQTMRRQLSVSSNTEGIRRLIRPGDHAYAYQLESGLWEATNQIIFRGETITPIEVRLLSLSWPIEPTYGVYVFNNDATPTVLDVTRWIEDEGTSAFWTVGDWSPPNYGPVNRSSPEVEERLSEGDVSVVRVRATATDDASLSSTDHGLQVGATSGLNVIADGNEIMARNNGAESQLNLNVDGGLVKAGTGGLGANWTTVTTGVTEPTDWDVDDFDAWVAGHFLQFRLVVSRKNSAITNPASGNITNETVGTLPASCRGDINLNLNCHGAGASGRMAGGTFNPSTGVVQIVSIGGSSNLAIGESVTFGGLFIITA